MARTVTLLGTNYSIPETSDNNYDAALTTYLVALATAFPQLNGTNGTLTAELDFGAAFGLKSLYYKSRTANPASVGQIRLAKADTIGFRNNANGADLAMTIDTADALTFNGANVTGNPMLNATTTAGQSISSGTITIVVYGTVNRDSDSAYNSGTGRYTIPTGKGGDYLISAAATWNTSPGTVPYISVYKNAAESLKGLIAPQAGGGTMPISGVLNLAAGDIIDIRVNQASGGPISLNSGGTANYFSLKRIPT